LAREPAADDIDANSVSGQSVGCEGSNVVVLGDAWPVLCEDFPAIRFDLAEGDGFKSAGAFKAEGEAADS
jgi:hypothetical protein